MTQPYRGERPIVFFDGDCIMCNAFVTQLTQIDAAHTLFIATLQGETAHQYLPPLPQDREAWSFYYLDDRGYYDQSDAFVQLCRHLGGLWSLLALIRIIPTPIRNAIYQLIARNRYRWFGRRTTCRIPTIQEQQRFLP